jgi:hypothetical protein
MELETLFRDLVEILRAKDPSRLHQPHRLRDIQYGLIPYRLVRDDLDLSCSEDHEMLLLRLCSGEGDFFEISDSDASQALQAEADGLNPDLSLLQVYGEVNVVLASAAVERVLSGPGATRAAEFAPPGEEKNEQEDPEESADAEADVAPLARPNDFPIPPAAHEPTIIPLSPMAPTAEPESEPESLSNDAVHPSESVEHPEDAQEESVPASRPTPPPFDILPSETTVTQCDFCGGSLPDGRQANFCPHCGQNLASIRCKNCSADLEWGWRHCINCGEAVPDV